MAEKYGKWWVKGDWNGFFGLFVNIVTNTLVLTTLLLYVVNVPAGVVFGKVLPALGLSIALGNIYYAYIARRMARKEQRADVTALPYGTGVEHIFICTFVVMGPVYWKTGDPIFALQTGMGWCVVEAVIEILGAFFGEHLRRVTPQAAMLGSVSGLAITLIAMNPAMQSWEFPYIAFISIALFLLGWVANKRLPFGIPAGMVMVVGGSIIGWLTGYMKPDTLVEAVANVRVAVPFPDFAGVVAGVKNVAPYLATAIPLGIGNVIGSMDNVESAKVAGDDYNLTEVLLVNGAGSLLGGLCGNPFPTCVYIGHPGWKSIGGRIGYAMMTGVGIMVICCLGLCPVFLALVPMPAVLPILLYIGLVIGAQAFYAVPPKHYIAITFAIIPWMANWGVTLVNNALGAAGTSSAAEGMIEILRGHNIAYRGLATLGNGPALTSMILAALTVFVVDGEYKKASFCGLLAAALSYIGLMHAEVVGFGMATGPALGYSIIALMFLAYDGYDKKFAGKYMKTLDS